MKTTTAFKALTAKRAREYADRNTFFVRALKKDGSVSQARVDPTNMCSTREAADARRAEMERLNPGSRYVVTVSGE